jgi:hypothetical protein
MHTIAHAADEKDRESGALVMANFSAPFRS